MTRSTQTIALPTTSPGMERHLTVWRWGTPGARPKVYIQSALHADEWPGLMTSHHLCGLLDAADAEGRITGEVVLLPYANPIGMSQIVNEHVSGRYRLADGGGNFNRDWPDMGDAVKERLSGKLGDDPATNIATMRAALLEAVSELPDTMEKDAHRKALLGLSIDADYVLDLHCDWEATLHLFSHAEHTDIVMELARDMGVPVILLDTGILGGPFDETHANAWIKVRQHHGLSESALPAACFSTTIELRGQCDVSDELGSADAANMFNFLMRRGVIDGDAPVLPAALGQAERLDACDMFTAPCAGLIAWKKALGDHVQKGDLLAEIIDITQTDAAKARTPVLAGQTGMLFSMHVDRLTRPGEIIGKVAGKEPLAHRQSGGSLLSNR